MVLSLQDKKLLRLLLEDGVVTQQQIPESQMHSLASHELQDALVLPGHVEFETFLQYKAKAFSIDRADLSGAIDPALQELVPAHEAEKHHIVPLAVKQTMRGKVLQIAMAEPSDLAVLDELRFKTDCQIEPQLASSEEINSTIRRYYYNFSDIDAFELAAGAEDDEEVLELTEEVPVEQSGFLAGDMLDASVVGEATLPHGIDPIAPDGNNGPAHNDLLDPFQGGHAGPKTLDEIDLLDIGAEQGPSGSNDKNALQQNVPVAAAAPAVVAAKAIEMPKPEEIANELEKALAGQAFQLNKLPQANMLIIGITRVLAPKLGVEPSQLIQSVLDTVKLMHKQ